MSIFTRTAEEIKSGVGEIKRRFLSNGTSYMVRITDLDSFVEYKVHGDYFLRTAYKVYPSACTAKAGMVDLYCKALKLMYDDRDKIKEEKGEDSEEYKKLDAIIKDLRAKDRRLFGFINLDDGKPLIIELTPNQADSLYELMVKNQKKIHKSAFELYKSGAIGLVPQDPEEDLTPKQKQNWEKTKDIKIDFEQLFEKAVYIKNEEQQVLDLHKLGFDVTRLGYEPPKEEEEREEEQPKPITPNDLPF